MALLAGLGVGIAALCGAFNQEPKHLCGRLKFAGEDHTFLVPADRTRFVSLVSAGGSLEVWTQENGTSYKSSQGLQVEVKNNDINVKTAHVVKEMYPSCENASLDIANTARGMLEDLWNTEYTENGV